MTADLDLTLDLMKTKDFNTETNKSTIVTALRTKINDEKNGTFSSGSIYLVKIENSNSFWEHDGFTYVGKGEKVNIRLWSNQQNSTKTLKEGSFYLVHVWAMEKDGVNNRHQFKYDLTIEVSEEALEEIEDSEDEDVKTTPSEPKKPKL